MDLSVFKELLIGQLISEEEFKNIELQKEKPLSVHWDLRTLLYLGIVLLTTALGIIIYKNIDTIGHQAILIIIAIACITCFGYCIKNSKGYSNRKIDSPNIWFDYVLLTGCLLLLTFVGYIQFEYNVFGNRWGLATFIPMIILFIAAYYFDHLGVLSLAIINLAAWAGISVTPLRILKENDFNDTNIIYTGLILGAMLVAISFVIQLRNIKAHFAFTYKNFGAHILFISLLACMFYFENIYLVWFIVLAGVNFLFFKNAVKESSFYFLVITLLYTYIALSYVVVQLVLISGFDMLPIYFVIIYFIVSGIALIRFFIHYNKILKRNAGLQ
ncbi:MAG: DUF2157 domain-containing protein [Ginsengibacter sp.]